MVLSIQDVLKLENKPTKHVAKFMMDGKEYEFEFFSKEMKISDSIEFREFIEKAKQKKPAVESLLTTAKFIEVMVVDEKGNRVFNGIESIIGGKLDDDFNLIENGQGKSLPDGVFSAIVAILNKENDFKEDEGKG